MDGRLSTCNGDLDDCYSAPKVGNFSIISLNKKIRTDSMDKLFQTAEWAHTTNIYEVNVRQYTAEGSFNAFAKELPRL
jgi:hypothetical protein